MIGDATTDMARLLTQFSLKHGVIRILAVCFAALWVAANGQALAQNRLMQQPPGSPAQPVLALFSDILDRNSAQSAVNTTSADTQSEPLRSQFFAEHALAATRGDVDFFLTSPISHLLMQEGRPPFAPQPNGADAFRLLFMFNYGFYHIAVHQDSGIWSFGDIAGKRVYLGEPGSGSDQVAQTLLTALTGYQAGQAYIPVTMPWADAHSAFANRRHQVHIFPALPPDPNLLRIGAGTTLRLLSLTEADFEEPALQALFAVPGRIKGRIPPGNYNGGLSNSEPVQTIGAMVGLATTADMADDLIYRVVADFWGTVTRQSIQKPWLRWLAPDSALMTANMPLHPGALRFYQEQGLEVPAALQPQPLQK